MKVGQGGWRKDGRNYNEQREAGVIIVAHWIKGTKYLGTGRSSGRGKEAREPAWHVLEMVRAWGVFARLSKLAIVTLLSRYGE